MVFIHDSDEGEDDGDGEDELLPRVILPKIEGRRKESGCSEKKDKMNDLIDMRKIEDEASRRVKLITVGKKVQKDEPKNKTGSPKARALFERFHRLVAITAATHFFFHPLGEPLLHHGLVVEEARAGDPLEPGEHAGIKAQSDGGGFTGIR